jgi:hypothetical protein
MLQFVVEFLLEILVELILVPFRLLLHWIVRRLGGCSPQYSLIWKYACRFFMLLAVGIFCGAIFGIIAKVIGPFTMFWMFVGSIVLFLVAGSASDAVVWEPPDLKASLDPPRKHTEDSLNSQQ